MCQYTPIVRFCEDFQAPNLGQTVEHSEQGLARGKEWWRLSRSDYGMRDFFEGKGLSSFSRRQ